MTGSQWCTREVLITVKAYPNPSSTYGETVCVAGVTKDEGWIRLYPVPYRDLPDPHQFKKYQWVTLSLKKNRRDKRPESFRGDLGSIRLGEFLSTQGRSGWDIRKEILMPTVSASMCEIQRLQRDSGKSLGMFRPASVDDFIVEDVPGEWTGRKREALGQGMFWSRDKKRLEKIPFTFLYRYHCADPGCKGHKQSILDWEIAELYRNVRRKHSDKEEIKALIRRKFLDELCGEGKDTHFFVGNMAKRKQNFVVLGVFWPPKDRQASGPCPGTLFP